MVFSKIPTVCMYNVLSYLTPKKVLLDGVVEFSPKSALINALINRLTVLSKFGTENNNSIRHVMYEDINIILHYEMTSFMTYKLWETRMSRFEYTNITDIYLLLNSSIEIQPIESLLNILRKFTYSNIKKILNRFDITAIEKWIWVYNIKKDDTYVVPPPYHWMYEEEDRTLKQKYSDLIKELL